MKKHETENQNENENENESENESENETRKNLPARNSTYLERYNKEEQDPYAAYAQEGGPGIRGTLLACRQGVWSIGKDAVPVKEGTRFLFVVPETTRGWLKWQNGVVVIPDVGYVRDGFVMRSRYELGDDDDTKWEIFEGKPRDPWKRDYRALLIELSPPHGEYTFVSGAWGAHLALQDLCGKYSAEGRAEGLLPVVELATRTRPNKRFGGNLTGPWFDIVGWATIEDVKAGRKRTAAKAPPKAEPKAKGKTRAKATTGEQIGDELPADWGPVKKK